MENARNKGFKFQLLKVQSTANQKNLSVKAGLSPSKNVCVTFLIETPLKVIKNVFYFALKAFFILKMFKFLSQHFGHVGKTA